MVLVLQVVPTLPHPAHPGPAQLEQHRVDGHLAQLISNHVSQMRGIQNSPSPNSDLT